MTVGSPKAAIAIHRAVLMKPGHFRLSIKPGIAVGAALCRTKAPREILFADWAAPVCGAEPHESNGQRESGADQILYARFIVGHRIHRDGPDDK